MRATVHFLAEMVDVPVVTRNSCPSYSEIQKSAKIHTHFQYTDRFVDLPVAVQHRGPTVQRLRRFSQWQYLDQEIACPEGCYHPTRCFKDGRCLSQPASCSARRGRFESELVPTKQKIGSQVERTQGAGERVASPMEEMMELQNKFSREQWFRASFSDRGRSYSSSS